MSVADSPFSEPICPVVASPATWTLGTVPYIFNRGSDELLKSFAPSDRAEARCGTRV